MWLVMMTKACLRKSQQDLLHFIQAAAIFHLCFYDTRIT